MWTAFLAYIWFLSRRANRYRQLNLSLFIASAVIPFLDIAQDDPRLGILPAVGTESQSRAVFTGFFILLLTPSPEVDFRLERSLDPSFRDRNLQHYIFIVRETEGPSSVWTLLRYKKTFRLVIVQLKVSGKS
jgi:hypothetical protein